MFVGICMGGISKASASIVSPQDDGGIIPKGKKDKFDGWTEEQYRHYEDSVLSKLYPPVVVCKSEAGPLKPIRRKAVAPPSPMSVQNSHVPNTISVDRSKEVGEIAISSGASPTGAKTYSIPISVYPGMKGFTPNLALSYNSQQGNSTLGMGWSVSGISMIARGGKTLYYDGKVEGIKLDYNDSFVLDGVRLIKTSTASDHILYESEQGNIKVKGFFSGTSIKYFEVFFPDGNKGIFGYTSNTQSLLSYPLLSLKDLYGNTISYEYIYSDNHYCISKISYNGCSVEFQYADSRMDPILAYSGGLKVYEPRLLKTITSKYGTKVLGTYTMSYTVEKNKSLLTKVDCSVSGKSYNPILFYYGEGLTPTSYTTSATQLLEWYKSEDPNMIKVVKGKFDYGSNADGLIVLPNKTPYWKHYRGSSMFRHSQNRFDNYFNGDEKIFLYAGLNGGYASPMPNLFTEKGFIDIVCGDLEGKQEEYVVKINNQVVNNSDRITFNIYRYNYVSGMARLYTRNYNFSTVYTDADGGKSIQPKFYYTGDFNGDGKTEVLAVAIHQPFGDTGKPSMCYMFDLVNNRIMYQSHVFPFNMDFVGVRQTDPDIAENNSDKLLVMDYDGDGKTDICHINESGANIYTFETYGANIVGTRKIASYTGLRRSGLANRRLLMGEFNGDGLTDMLVSPSSKDGTDHTWTVYNSKGNGQFDKSTFSGPYNDNDENTGFVIQDINGDGMTDLIKYNASGFFTYLASNNNVGVTTCYSNFPTTKSILIPTNINSRNSFTQLISLKEGTATKYSFAADYGKETLVTGVAKSFGVIEKNRYSKANEDAGVYSKGNDAVYPYVNLNEPLTLITCSETHVNGKATERNSYRYTNAVAHRQGLGFCGFEEIRCNDIKEHATVSTYDPYKRGVLKSMRTLSFTGEYDFSVSTQSNHLLKVLLAKKTEKDLLKGITASTTYTYDSYGYPTEENVSYSEGTTVKKTNAYSNMLSAGDGYNLGFLTDQIYTVTRGGESYTERTYIPAYSHRQPNVRLLYKNGNVVNEEIFSYDRYGNTLSSSVRLFAGTNRQTTAYEYNSYGKLTKTTDAMGLVTRIDYNDFGQIGSVTDFRGGVTTYSYDAFGREVSVSYPDNTHKTTTFAWTAANSSGLYEKAQEITGRPKSAIAFDALNREVRTTENLLNGKVLIALKIYNEDGLLWRTSTPYDSSSPPVWNTYTYDFYDRPISFIDATGATTRYEYSGNSVTTISKGISKTQTYDVLGNLVSVSDPSGTITYQVAPDGKPVSITAPGNITTSFEYDKYRRRIRLVDPSMGATTYEYDAYGNVSRETDANGKAKQYEYDQYNRLVKSACSEFTTSYKYNTVGDLVEVNTSNGTGKMLAYDTFGRLMQWKQTAPDGKWLQKNYTYANGNVSSIEYTSQTGLLAKENYVYLNGSLKSVNLNGTTNVYSISSFNSLGMVSGIVSGNITRSYGYTSTGLLTGRSGASVGKTYQDVSYAFDANTSNLLSRKDNTRNISESFEYDELNRLTAFGGKTTNYDSNGNITAQSDIGTFGYGIVQKPYAVSDVSLTSANIPTGSQEVAYTSFSRPQSVSENGYTAEFIYDEDYDRIRMSMMQNGKKFLTRYYLGDCYEQEETPTSIKERLYLGGDYYSAPAVLIKEGGVSKLYYILRDHLGSITQVIDSEGKLVQELSFDAWGRLRNPDNLQVYDFGEEPVLFLGRGYTGHEHLPQFGLVNMNARLYDAALGRFLSPDPYVQMPDFSQNFNRYSYCVNNPLEYVDKNGEFFFGFFSGFFRGLFQGKNPLKTGWKTGINELKIYAGLFSLDSNKGFFGKTWELISRFTWQLPQTMIGSTYSNIANWTWQVDHVDHWGGATVLSGNNWGLGSGAAVTIGSFISGSNSLKADPNNYIFQHEYGHYLQSQSMGWGYLSKVGIPSLLNASKKGSNHKFQPYEQDANYRAFMYFNRNVPSFYQTEKEYRENMGLKGWNFFKNPLNIDNKTFKYKDYHDSNTIQKLESLKITPSWYDYLLGPTIVGGAGVAAGIVLP